MYVLLLCLFCTFKAKKKTKNLASTRKDVSGNKRHYHMMLNTINILLKGDDLFDRDIPWQQVDIQSVPPLVVEQQNLGFDGIHLEQPSS